MEDWTVLPASATGVGGIPSGTTVTALYENPIAMAKRAPGAPKVIGSDYELISRTVISGTPATLDVTFDPSLYDVIEIELANVVPTSDLTGFIMRTSSDGGATFDSGASDYASSITTFQMGAASSNEGGSSGTNDINLTGNAGSAGGENGVSLSIKIIGPNLAQRTFIKFGGGWMDAGGNYVETNGAAYRKTAAIVNAVRFFFSSGNLESGVVTVYGKRNA